MEHEREGWSALLLAGGRSLRMGRDKALLPWRGQPLWEHQLSTLEALGPRELLVSRGGQAPLEGMRFGLVEDRWPDAGPVGGIAGGLAAMRGRRLMVLAVDLPLVSATFLRTLLKGDAGAVGIDERGRFEPLAAVYPHAALEVAEERVGRGRCSLQELVGVLVARGLMHARVLSAADRGLLRNVNSPADHASASEGLWEEAGHDDAF